MTSPKVLVAAAAALLAAIAAPALAQDNKIIGDGRYEYQGECQNCHGLMGRGEGAVAELLIVTPPDLTQIAKRNGGTFPFWTVYDIIAGDKPVRAHQFSGMPLWGQRFRAEEEAGTAAPADIRILLLTHYLESIQEQ